MTRLVAEDLLLLCWDDGKGTVHRRCSSTVAPGIGAALVVDAVLVGALEVHEGRVQVTGTDPGDTLLAEVAAQADRRRPPSVTRLVQRVGTPAACRAVRDRLVGQGVLRAERRRLLGILPYTRHPPADPAACSEWGETVRALLTGRIDPAMADARAVVLAGLTAPTNAVAVLVARADRKPAQQRAASFSQGPAVAAALGPSVGDTQAAATTAVTAAVAASAVSTSGGSPGQARARTRGAVGVGAHGRPAGPPAGTGVGARGDGPADDGQDGGAAPVAVGAEPVGVRDDGPADDGQDGGAAPVAVGAEPADGEGAADGGPAPLPPDAEPGPAGAGGAVAGGPGGDGGGGGAAWVLGGGAVVAIWAGVIRRGRASRARRRSKART